MSDSKPGLSNEEFVKSWRNKPITEMLDDKVHEGLAECLDRLEAIIGQGQEERDLTPEEALAEARRRWPEERSVIYDSSYENGTEFRVSGGIYNKKREFKFSHGMGNSFRAAFASADKARGGKEIS